MIDPQARATAEDAVARMGIRGSGKSTAKRRALLIEYKRAVGACFDCGEPHPPHVLEFDHLPHTAKAPARPNTPHRTQLEKIITSLATLWAEVAKCDVVCANCHRQRTYERKQAA